VPQEIGRVILNLINNAFYAVSAKAIDYAKASSDELATADGGYEPTVTVTTKKSTNKVEILVRDNGTGIPQKLMDKIFQPFFTTKPTGQGPGWDYP
jgi:signal transduction histidine kinase